jgi:transcriptional regulator with XRE-family HTH domain
MGRFGKELARLMEERSTGVRELARLVPCNPGHISNLRSGRDSPSASMAARLDALLGAAGSILGASSHESQDVRGERKYHSPDDPGSNTLREDVASVLYRVHELARGTIDPAVIGQLRDSVLDAVEQYEMIGHAKLVPALLKLRALTQTLLHEARRPSQQRELLEVAGVIAGLLGYVAVGPGNFGLARAYCREAFVLGDYAAAPVLQAWARATASFCEYYAGRYDETVRLARDGLSYAGSGPQSVRLSVNGLARALGKLGDAEGVHRAVDCAYEFMSRNEVPDGVPSSIALGCYSEALTASNAATAYVALGMPRKARHYASMALPEITEKGPRWSRSLIMIDLALADVLALTHPGQENGADLDQAAGLVLDAMRISTGRPVISVSQLQSGEVRPAVVSGRDDLTIQDQGAAACGCGQDAEFGERAGDVLAGAGPQPQDAVAEQRCRAHPVVLGLG